METPDEHPVSIWRYAAIATTVAAVRLVWSAIRAPAGSQVVMVPTGRGLKHLCIGPFPP